MIVAFHDRHDDDRIFTALGLVDAGTVGMGKFRQFFPFIGDVDSIKVHHDRVLLCLILVFEQYGFNCAAGAVEHIVLAAADELDHLIPLAEYDIAAFDFPLTSACLIEYGLQYLIEFGYAGVPPVDGGEDLYVPHVISLADCPVDDLFNKVRYLVYPGRDEQPVAEFLSNVHRFLHLYLMGQPDDGGAFTLPVDGVELCDRNDIGSNQIFEHCPRPHRRQLVAVADEDEDRIGFDIPHELIEQPCVDHRHFIDDDQFRINFRIDYFILARVHTPADEPMDG